MILWDINENSLQVVPSSPLQKQPSVGNVLARTSSFGESNRSSPINTSLPRQSSNTGSSKQGSPSSIFEQFTHQAKELVRETKRQSSQDGLLAQMDKVSCLRQRCSYRSNTYL